MSIDPNHKRVSMSYNSDDGNTYAIVTTAGHRSSTGGSAAAPGTPGYPRGWKTRHLNLTSTDGTQKAKVTLQANTAVSVIIGQPWTVPGLGDFVVTGYTGEKIHRAASN